MPSDLPRRLHTYDEVSARPSSVADRWVRGTMVGITSVAAIALISLPFLHRSAAPRIAWSAAPSIAADHLPTADAARLDATVRDAFERALVGRSGLTVASTELSLSDALARARGTGPMPDATEVVAVAVRCTERRCAVEVARHRVIDGSVIWRRSGSPIDASDLATLAKAVEGAVDIAYLRYRPLSGRPRLHVDPEGYRTWIDLRLADQPDLEALAALRQRAPRFVEPYLLEAWARGGRGESEAARHLLANASRIAPDDPRPTQLLRELGLDR